jgi:putative oxidoreductase
MKKIIMNTDLRSDRMDYAVAFFRIAISAMMLTHGVPKLLMLFSGSEIMFADPIGFGMGFSLALVVSAEFLSSILLILGLFTRVAASILTINMFVAAVIFHANDPFAQKELAFMFLTAYIFLVIVGSGKISMDRFITRSRN